MSELSCAHNSLNRDEYLKSQNVAENSLTLKEEAMGQTPSYSNHTRGGISEGLVQYNSRIFRLEPRTSTSIAKVFVSYFF